MKTNETIFGYAWADIQAAQQGHRLAKPLPACDGSRHAIEVQNDVDKFRIPVAAEVKDRYALILPLGYNLQGDIWVYTGTSTTP